jgi:hypothetical protein
MKKFYYGVVLALLSAVLPTQKNFAQNACPTDRPQKVFNAVGFNALGQKVNFVYIEGFIANANMSLFEAGTIYSTVSFTDANGSGKYVYNGATQHPDQVSSCLGAGCCVKPVPAVTACVANVLNVKYPPNPAAGIPTEICCIYLSNSLASADVKVFDENQNLIPTSSFTNASTDISGFTCYVYPCDKTPTSITACGATGCCSQQVRAQAALPVKLSGFTAKLTADKKAQLNWISELEIGSDKYVVERSSDGRNFNPIAEVKSLGNTAASRSYSYNDGGFSTLAFYRLKMIDIDGQVAYSKVVYANNKSGSGVITQIFPNPFKSDIQLIGINSSDLNNKNIRVFSPTGQQIGFQITGANAISLSPGLPAGLYILSVKDQKFKLMKQ